jgi:hypothetical protein
MIPLVDVRTGAVRSRTENKGSETSQRASQHEDRGLDIPRADSGLARRRRIPTCRINLSAKGTEVQQQQTDHRDNNRPRNRRWDADEVTTSPKACSLLRWIPTIQL